MVSSILSQDVEVSFVEDIEREMSIEPREALVSHEPIRIFQVLKQTHHLPPVLSFPPTLSFDIVATISTPSNPSPSYHTSCLPAIFHKPFVPPSFSVFAGVAPHTSPGPRSEIPEPEVAKLSFKGGFKNLEILIAKTGRTEHSADAEPRATNVKRRGWGREYHFTLSNSSQLTWKGMKSRPGLTSGIGDGKHEASGTKHHGPANGNLKLVTLSEPDKILALWENKIDPTVLGNLLLYEDFKEREGLEEVILGCLGVVLGERVRYKGWFTWEAKGYSKLEQERDNLSRRVERVQ